MSVQDDVIFTVDKYDIFHRRKQKMSRRKRSTKALLGPIWPLRQESTEHILRGAANMRPQHWDSITHIQRQCYQRRWRRRRVGSATWFGARWTVLVITLLAKAVVF